MGDLLQEGGTLPGRREGAGVSYVTAPNHYLERSAGHTPVLPSNSNAQSEGFGNIVTSHPPYRKVGENKFVLDKEEEISELKEREKEKKRSKK